MSTEKNKAIVRRVYDALNTKDEGNISDMMDEIFATDIVEHLGRGDVIHGLKNDKQLMHIQQADHDEELVVEDMIAEGDKVVARWTQTYTHKPNNKRVKMWGISIYRVVGGKIVERWVRFDTLGLQQQLGKNIPSVGLLPTQQKEK